MLARPWFRVFELTEEEKAAAAAAAKLEAEKLEAERKEKEENEKPKFTQNQLNKILADDRRKHEASVQKAMQELEQAKKAKGLSEAEKQSLQARIDELSSSLMTKEEQAKLEIEKRDKQYKTTLETESAEKTFWQEQYSAETTRNQILAAAIEFEAVRAPQIMDLLMPKTRLVELLDADGKSLTPKKFGPKVRLKTINDKGEEIELDLTIKEAVKRMKDEPDNYGNLFKSGLAGGLGAGGSQGGGGNSNNNRPPADPKAYRIWRQQQKNPTKGTKT